MQHIVLLGDSIFDNGVYVGSKPDVATQLKQLAPADRYGKLLKDGWNRPKI